MIKENKIKTVFTATDATSRVLSKIQNRITSMAARASVSMNKFTKSTNGIAESLTGKLKWGLVGITAASYGIIQVLEKIMGSFSIIENAEASFTPLLGSAEKARILVEKLNEAAAVTPFEFVDLANSVKQLLPVMNGNIENTMDTILRLGDIAGGNAEQLWSATHGYTKALLKGKVDLKSLNMMAEAGIPIYSELSKSMGIKSMAEFFKSVTAGKVSIGALDKALKDMTSEGGMFFKSMEISSKTFSGIMSTLKDEITIAMAEIGEAIAPELKDLQLEAIKIAKAFRLWAAANKGVISKKFKDFINFFKENGSQIITWIKRIALAVVAFYAFNFILTTLNATLQLLNFLVAANPFTILAISVALALIAIYIFRDEINRVMYEIFDIVAEFGNVFAGIGSALSGLVGQALTPLFWVINNAVTMWQSILQLFVDICSRNWDAVAAKFVAVWNFIKSYYLGIWNTILSVPFTVWEAMKAVGSFFVDLWNGNWDAIGARFVAVWDGIKAKAGEVVTWIMDALGPLGNLIQSITNIEGVFTGRVDVVPNVADMFDVPELGQKIDYDIFGMPTGKKETTSILDSLGLGDLLKKYSDTLKNTVPAQLPAATGALNQTATEAPKPQVARERVHAYTPDELEYYLKEEKVERAEITIQDKTGRTIVTRGKLPRGTKLVHSGAM